MVNVLLSTEQKKQSSFLREKMQTTVRGKIKVQNTYAVLDQVAEHFGHARRSIFEDLNLKKLPLSEIKKTALVKYEITARQFNSIRYELQGVIKADQELSQLHFERLQRRIQKNLDFEKKKEELRSRHLNRMLSSFAYSKFYQLIHTQCIRAGVELIQVNPAYTSIIGKHKFSEGYGLSTHMAAAMAIARRGLGFGEALRTNAQKHSSLPARNRRRHVWRDWGILSRSTKRRRKSSLRRQRPERAQGGRRPSRSTPWNGPPSLHGLG
jgi:hypothetical protein